MSHGCLRLKPRIPRIYPWEYVNDSAIWSYGCSEDGAIILADLDRQQMVVIMPVDPADVWIRFYTELSDVSGASLESAYGSYEVGTLAEIVRSAREAFDDMTVVQGGEAAAMAGLTDEFGRVIPLTEEEEEVKV